MKLIIKIFQQSEGWRQIYCCSTNVKTCGDQQSGQDGQWCHKAHTGTAAQLVRFHAGTDWVLGWSNERNKQTSHFSTTAHTTLRPQNLLLDPRDTMGGGGSVNTHCSDTEFHQGSKVFLFHHWDYGHSHWGTVPLVRLPVETGSRHLEIAPLHWRDLSLGKIDS